MVAKVGHCRWNMKGDYIHAMKIRALKSICKLSKTLKNGVVKERRIRKEISGWFEHVQTTDISRSNETDIKLS